MAGSPSLRKSQAASNSSWSRGSLLVSSQFLIPAHPKLSRRLTGGGMRHSDNLILKMLSLSQLAHPAKREALELMGEISTKDK